MNILRFLVLLSLFAVLKDFSISIDDLLSMALRNQPEGIVYIELNAMIRPNIISTAPTHRVKKFLEKLKDKYPMVFKKSPLEVSTFLAKYIYDTKEDSTLSVKELYGPMINYWKHYKSDTVYPDVYFDLKYPVCEERSVFLSSLLKLVGVENRLVFMCIKDLGWNLSHVLVVVFIGNKAYFLDPTQKKHVFKNIYSYYNYMMEKYESLPFVDFEPPQKITLYFSISPDITHNRKIFEMRVLRVPYFILRSGEVKLKFSNVWLFY